jgi:predicted MFS family arabinose efflux permease
MGVAAAAGSFGQFLMVPVEGWLISSLGWQQALLALSLMVLLIVPLAFGLREPGFTHPPPPGATRPLRRRWARRSLPQLSAADGGLFCVRLPGGVHWRAHAQLPARTTGLSPQVASYALALIGLFNVFGTYIAGTLGQRMPSATSWPSSTLRGPW